MTQLEAMLLSLLVEIPIAIFVLRKKANVTVLISGFAAGIATCISHPVAWHISRIIGPESYPWHMAEIELSVVLVEGLVLKGITKANWKSVFGASLFTNVASMSAGFLL